MTATVLAFAIQTSDEHWIKRNGARIDDAGLAVIMLPASELELITLGQKPYVYLRNGLAKGNYPRELQWQSSLDCPAEWVPETAAYLAASDGHDHYDYAERHHRHHDDEALIGGLREDLGRAEERIADLERASGRLHSTVAASLASLNEVVAELAAVVSTDPAFLDMVVGVLRDSTWKLGFEFQGTRAPADWHDADGGG